MMEHVSSTVNGKPFKPSSTGPVERGRLDATLEEVAEVIRALQLGRTDIDPRPVFAELRVDLELHFALEEGDANFGSLLRERPGLAHELDALRSEHTALLEKLDYLRTVALEPTLWPKLANLGLELAEAFRAHEHREADLLQEFVLRDEGTAD